MSVPAETSETRAIIFSYTTHRQRRHLPRADRLPMGSADSATSKAEWAMVSLVLDVVETGLRVCLSERKAQKRGYGVQRDTFSSPA